MPSHTALYIALAALTASCACQEIVEIDRGRIPSTGTEETAGSGGSTAAPWLGGDAGSAGCGAARRILVDEIVNGRDLGGVPLVGGAKVACGQIFRAAAPDHLTLAGCDEFARLGIRTVVDLRVDSEVAVAPPSFCVVDQATIVRAPMPVPYTLSEAQYLDVLSTTESMAEVFRVLGDEQAYPVYLHCTWGRDRTGVVTAVVLLALGATREVVMQEYQLTSAAGLAIAPGSLEAVLDEIETRGGVGAYLQAAGVTEAEVAALRQRAISR